MCVVYVQTCLNVFVYIALSGAAVQLGPVGLKVMKGSVAGVRKRVKGRCIKDDLWSELHHPHRYTMLSGRFVLFFFLEVSLKSTENFYIATILYSCQSHKWNFLLHRILYIDRLSLRCFFLAPIPRPSARLQVHRFPQHLPHLHPHNPLSPLQLTCSARLRS